MAKRRLGIMALLLCFCLYLMPGYAQAASTTDAKEPISPDRDCTLTIGYSYDGAAFPDQRVQLFKVAEVSADFQYTLTPSFATSGLILNGVQTNGEWNVIRSTLEALILANNTEPVATVVTDALGNACFDSLKPGLYLASAVDVVREDLHCSFGAALIAVPGLGADGLWQYQVAVAAKPEILPPVESDEDVEFKVLKLWKGDGSRPQSIEVELYRNGTSYETVTLSEENHWSYSWLAKDDGASWIVVERNVPAGYAMTVEQRGTAFVLTNTLIPETPDDPSIDPPKTGDTTNVLLYTVLLYVSGTILILLGIAGKRKRHEKAN